MSTETRQAEAAAVLAELAQNVEVLALIEKLRVLQFQSEQEGWWDTSAGHKIENAEGYLKMALEAAGHQF